jgi:CIC family chloride channel protein
VTAPHRHLPVRLLVLARRSQQALLLAGVTGAITGLVVAGFERLTSEVLLAAVLDLPVALQAAAPAVGLVLAVACLRYLGRDAGAGTSDEYIRAFHDQGRRLDLAPVPARLLAAVATLGAGVPLGYEGPSLYAGAAIGSALQRRLGRFLTVDDSKLLLVAGAAAGVAAIFKAPVTGLVFAMEVPYQEDLARRMLLPAAISAAAAYVTFAAFAGTDPILPVGGQAPFNLVDLGGAAVVGLVAGLLARVFIAVIRQAKALSTRGRPLVRALIGGAILAATVLLGYVLSDQPLALGPGYNALRWALAPQRSVLGIVALGTLRVAGTAGAILAGGVGGLFIPLVIQGALVGRAVGGIFDPANASLFPVVGMAAFLGAGYRVPLAAVVFVAEFTGRPGFVVPGLIAAVVAQLVMGRSSISPYQVAGRVGHLEKRLSLPLATLVDAGAHTVPPDATAEELFWQHLVGTRQRSVAVVDGSSYLGMVRAEDLARVDRDDWPTTRVTEVMRTDLPVALPAWTVADAIRAMEEADADRLAMCDGARYAGMISAEDIVKLDDILRETSATPAD